MAPSSLGFSFLWASLIASLLLPYSFPPSCPQDSRMGHDQLFLHHLKFLGVTDHRISVAWVIYFFPNETWFCLFVALASCHFHCKKKMLCNKYFSCLVKALMKQKPYGTVGLHAIEKYFIISIFLLILFSSIIFTQRPANLLTLSPEFNDFSFLGNSRESVLYVLYGDEC